MEKLSVEDLERLREKEFAERVERIQNTMSRFRKIAYILMVIAAVFMFFHARNDYIKKQLKRNGKRQRTMDNITTWRAVLYAGPRKERGHCI